MKIHQLPNAAATVITVTATATTLEDLIRATTGNGGYRIPTGPQAANSLFAQVLTQSVKYLVDGNIPTAALGYAVFATGSFSSKGIDLSKVKLIRGGGVDATVAIQIAKVLPGEF